MMGKNRHRFYTSLRMCRNIEAVLKGISVMFRWTTEIKKMPNSNIFCKNFECFELYINFLNLISLIVNLDS